MPESVKTATCGPENAAEFNAALRTIAPEAHALARELHRLGLIDGLRGARIRPLGADRGDGMVAVRPTLSVVQEARCADLEWQAGRGRDDAHEAEVREMNRQWMLHGRLSMVGG